jgi:transposase-like protein
MFSLDHRSPVADASQWTAEKQAAVVLRLLHGESIDRVSEETGVPVDELDSWRRVFIAAAAGALRKYGQRVEKEAAEERRRKAAQAPHSEFTAVPEPDPNAAKLPVPEHLHYLWVTLGLDDE